MGPIYEKQTPSYEVIDNLKSHLEKIEQWEADWIMCDEVWEDGLPVINKDLLDRWIVLQEERNELLNRF